MRRSLSPIEQTAPCRMPTSDLEDIVTAAELFAEEQMNY